MTDRKLELVRRDDACWAELDSLLDRLTQEQIVRDGYYPDWSVKDVLGHLASWYAETATVFSQMRMDTYGKDDLDVDALNAEWYLTWRVQDLTTVLTELNAARWRTLEEWGRIPEVTAAADEWFRESSYEHYDEHMPRLREWVAELVGPAT